MSSGPDSVCRSRSDARWSRCRASRVLGVALSCLLFGCGAAGFGDAREGSFGRAVDASIDDDWEDAAEAAQEYLSASTPDDTRYDRALMILAEACEKLGLSYAASMWFLDVAQSRRSPELVDKAVAGLERIVGAGPHDERTITEGFLASAEISGLRPELDEFVTYHQAVDSIHRGFDEWADEQIDRLPEGSAYRLRGRYVQSVRLLSVGQMADGEEELEDLLEEEELPEDVASDTRLALARLAMEESRFGEAVTRYEELRRLAPERPELLLEMAWAHFYNGDSRRALGLLIALDAPVYGALIAPERYLLEALCLARLCQFGPARIAATRLAIRHGEALAELHAGLPALESRALLEAARRRGQGRDIAVLLGIMRGERARADDLFGGDLAAALERVYRIGIAEIERREAEILQSEVQRLAADLIAAEDGVRLILHELAVGLLRGRARPPGPVEARRIEISATGDQVSYDFHGEFWTDELDDLVVTIEDRCLE